MFHFSALAFAAEPMFEVPARSPGQCLDLARRVRVTKLGAGKTQIGPTLRLEGRLPVHFRLSISRSGHGRFPIIDTPPRPA